MEKVMVIVQVGSNKGNTDNDPVWRLCQENLPDSLDWELLLIEPNPKGAKITNENYSMAGFRNFTVVICGISDKNEDLTLYVDNDIPGNEASQHASVYESHMYKMGHQPEALTKYKIKCYPLMDLIPLFVDYLQIDTEGHDGKIILGIDFDFVDIKKIEFEYAHLEKEELSNVISKLIKAGYKETSRTLEDLIYEK